jgi:NAD(P)H-dependent FMN reductase
MAKLIFISGSIRKESFNKKLTKQAFELAKELGADAKIVDLADFDMPIYNGDLEAEKGLPDGAKRLKKEFIAADGIFFSSPEYNSSISPLLKNAIDWISRKETKEEKDLVAFKGKVAALASASPGWRGGLRGLVTLRSILGNIGVNVLPDEVNVPSAPQAFDNEGKIKDERTGKNLKNLVQSLSETAEKLKQ